MLKKMKQNGVLSIARTYTNNNGQQNLGFFFSIKSKQTTNEDEFFLNIIFIDDVINIIFRN